MPVLILGCIKIYHFLQVKQLDLSGSFLNLNFPLNAVHKILPQVTERLYLRGNRLESMYISQLQDELHHIHPTVSTAWIAVEIVFEYFTSLLSAI